MKKFFRNLHIWLSIPFGLIIAIICFTGAALVFEDEITEMCRHDLYYVDKVEAQALPVPELMDKVAATLPDSVTVTGVTIASDPERAYQVNLSKPRRASIFIDQYTGEVKGKYERAPFFTFMFRMHRWLLDSMKPDGSLFVGKLVVGISTLMMVVVLVSGMIAWIPRTRKALKNGLKVSLNKGSCRLWYDLHVVGGIYAAVFLLLLALTGLTWSFPWYRTAFYAAFGVETQQQSDHGKPRAKDSQKNHRQEAAASVFIQWQKVVDQLKSQNPDYRKVTLSDGKASVSFARLGNQRASDSYAFNASNGEITEAKPYHQQDKTGKIRGWIYSVHVGNWGGLATRILTFWAALFGAILPITGYYLWIRKKMRRREKLKV